MKYEISIIIMHTQNYLRLSSTFSYALPTWEKTLNLYVNSFGNTFPKCSFHMLCLEC